MDCSNCYKDFCNCAKGRLADVKAASRASNLHYNALFLYKKGIIIEPTKTENIVVSYDWHTPRYISLRTLKFRWKGSKEWVSKSKKIRHLGFKLKEGKYKGLTVEEAIRKAPVYMKKFISQSNCIFLPECYFRLGFEKDDSIKDWERSKEGVLFPFGKYKGKSIEYVLEKDKPYIVWLVSNWKTEKSDFFNSLSALLVTS